MQRLAHLWVAEQKGGAGVAPAARPLFTFVSFHFPHVLLYRYDSAHVISRVLGLYIYIDSLCQVPLIVLP